MKPKPTKPSFTKIDSDTLTDADWTTQAAAKSTLDALKTKLQTNVPRRATYLKAALEAAAERVKLMQDGLEAAKKKKSGPEGIDTDDKLKTVRDDVKVLATQAKEVEDDYFTAMDGLRSLTSLNFAGAYQEYLSKVRTVASNTDKEVSTVTSKLLSLEGSSSALIKQIRALRGNMADGDQLEEKVLAAAAKAGKVNNEASESLKKIDSAVRSISSRLSTLPGSLGEMQTRSKDLSNAYERYTLGLSAVSAFKESIGAMVKKITDPKVKGPSEAELKKVEKYHENLLKERDAVRKNLDNLRREKALPAPVKKALPEKL